MQPFTPVQTRRTFQEAVEQIVEKVKLGELAVGDRLPSERALAEQMRISRPTLREAVRVLQDSGLVEVRRGAAGGIFVATELVPPELLATHREMRMAEVAQVLEARRMLEPPVALLAAKRGGPEDWESMQATIDAQQAIVDEGDALAEGREDRLLALDHRFHLALAKAAGNELVATFVRQLYRDLEIARDMAMHYEPVPAWMIAIHTRTLEAVRSGDAAEIETVMDEHLAQVERTWEQETGSVLARP